MHALRTQCTYFSRFATFLSELKIRTSTRTYIHCERFSVFLSIFLLLDHSRLEVRTLKLIYSIYFAQHRCYSVGNRAIARVFGDRVETRRWRILLSEKIKERATNGNTCKNGGFALDWIQNSSMYFYFAKQLVRRAFVWSLALS